MVFESVVSDLLNRFIGDYVENLDKSQLKIGIWGGNVVLENLKVKENALSEFNVPFKVKAGQIGKLTLKIPWKNLYSDAVVATLDGFYLLVVPGATGCQCTSCPYNEIKFDADKEERYQQELKQKDLQRIEDALSKEPHNKELLHTLESLVCRDPQHVPTGHKKVRKHRKGLRRSKGHGADVPQQEKKDTFVEKLATQVIKNLQVKISSIHLRYEDDVSDPTRPLSMGVTLSELSLQTTDENWKSCILNQAAKIIYKLARLDCLCAYWNVNSSMFYGGSWQEIIEQLKCGISSREQQVSSYQYIFRPIFASAKICINPTAELEMKGPKVDLHLEVQEICVEMTRAQYLTMVELLESIDYMVKNAPYRRFRPEVQVHHSPKLWWRYSFNSIMEVHVQRVRRMWSWSNIRQHRNNLRCYKNAYKNKLLSQSRAGSDTERQIQDLEKVLDVFNITLARQQAQMEVVRSGHKVGKNGQKQGGGGGGGGFFSNWFGRKAKKEEQEEPTGSEIDTLLTAEEKEKLYVAIGYSGSSHNLTLPGQYVAVVISFQLLKTSVTLRECLDVSEILKVQIINLCTKVSQRPGAQAIRVEAELRHWSVTGLQQNGLVPSLISSVGDSSSSLLSVNFELNPENSVSDQLLHVSSQPVEIIYDAGTVNRVVDFFRTEKGVDLEVLTSATFSKLEEIKEKTATGLSHIIKTRKVLDLRIDLKPSYLVLPKSGFYNPASEVLIVDFGNFQLHSVEQSSLGSSSSSLEEIMERAYERFSLELRRVQVLYSKSEESWKSARLQSSSDQHVLRPLDIKVQLAKCMVEKDARMARFKVCGELPLLHVRVSDQKIQHMVELIQSVPLPWTSSSPSATDKVLPKVKVRPAAPTLPSVLLLSPETDSEDSTEKSTDEENQRSALEELVDLHFKFEVKEVLLELTRQEVQAVQDVQEQSVLTFSVCQLGAEGKQRTFDLSLNTYLRKVCLDYCDLPGGPLHLVSSSDQQHHDLLKVDYIKANPDGPSFHSQFCSTEQTLKVEMSSLDFLLHTKALLSTITYLNHMFPTELSSKQSRKKPSSSSAAVSPGGKDGGVFSLKVLARLLCVHVEVCDNHQTIADIQVQGIDAAVSVQASQTEVFTRLRDIVVIDANPRTVHRKVVSIVGDEVFSFTLRLFSGATEGDAYSDVSNVDGTVTLRLSCIQIIYLHKFYMSLLMFVDNFQEAKEALSSATAQAAEKAASSVRDFAQKSFRVSMDVSLKAPLIIIPQSSTSHNALLMDLGLITVGNSFSLLPVEGFPLPAVMETMKVHLTQLKVCRTKLGPDVSQMDCDVLQPIDLELLVSRNLSSSWFSRIPAVQIQGVLHSLHVSLSEEDLSVVMKILVENIGEGSKAERVEVSRKKLTDEAGAADLEVKTHQCENGAGETSENITKLLLDFHIKEVLLTLRRTSPFLLLRFSQLGINTKVRRLDTCGSTYIRQITVECPGFNDCRGAPVCLVSSLVEPGSELLKVQYLKADRSAPNFSSFYKNTEQMINVTFSSLDLTLHTEALLSTMSFLSTALSSGSISSTDASIRPKVDNLRQSSSCTSSEDSHVIDLKVMMTLGSFNVLLCDQSCDITNIKIKGLHGSLLVQGSHTHVSTRLQDFLVLNVDPESVHKKAISILGEEVFSFSLNLTPNATEGSGYSDVSRTDGTVKLTVGCVRVVYLHRFIMALLNFSNSFQVAKEALSVATAQAAEKAASSVRDFAKKTFRLSVDVRLKAPIIVVPQSSRSHEALLVDLGLITARNSFLLTKVEGRPLPAVIDHMEVELTKLKLSRISTETFSEQSGTELLEPVNLHLNVRRNLSAAWYKEIPAVDVDGDLKPMKLQLSQDDLKVLLRILFENLSEAQVRDHPQQVAQQLHRPAAPSAGDAGKLQRSSSSEDEKEEEIMKFNFNIKSLGLVLYGSDSSLPFQLQHQQDLRLGELVLHLLSFSGMMQSGGGVEVSAVLTALTLDDLRSGVERASSRMVGRREQEGSEPMMDLTFRQRSGRKEVVTVLQKIYLCASVEFLLAVGEFFLQALPQSSASNASSATGDRTLAKQNMGPQARPQNASGSGSMLSSFRAVVVDPEVLFVASLRLADAPALAASFQCDMTLQTEEGGATSVRANLRELKVLACPFIRDQENCAVTTVLRPCSIALEAHQEVGCPLQGSVTVEEVIVKISPFIINTVTTITAAMMEKHHSVPLKEAEPAVGDLWSVMNIYGCNFWFLGVDPATEVTESFRETDGSNEGENFAVDVKVVQVTLESGLGHRTIPLLLAESSLSGSATNWSSLLQLKALMTLEVNYFNETHAVWEPLIERVDGGQRRWNLLLEMKTNPVHDKSPVPGDDFVLLPEPRSSITICSKDTMNITVSQSCLSVFSNLQKAFSEGSSSTFDPSLKEKAPFTVVNSLGIPLILHHSSNLRPVGCAAPGKLHELSVGQSLDLEHSVFEAWTRGCLSALQRQESSLFSLSIVRSPTSLWTNLDVVSITSVVRCCRRPCQCCCRLTRPTETKSSPSVRLCRSRTTSLFPSRC
ncbi:vacuolar protein sorting-associated protein 13C-like isoform X2 [Gouania willdenowi]|uniref:vacuolar protein sorting-associated protein 13C-like isoform X2 n=1 Tax=Gouania willdenowi TaxID=441366 RepID=UPI001054F379|nr:vacuolar protein sorting-associated protein 13C-like isoform X2 [Gouania willdenowi]